MHRAEELNSPKQLREPSVLSELREFVYGRNDDCWQVAIEIVIHNVDLQSTTLRSAVRRLAVVLYQPKTGVVAETDGTSSTRGALKDSLPVRRYPGRTKLAIIDIRY